MTTDRKTRVAYITIATITTVILVTPKYLPLSVLTWLYFQWVSVYAYTRTSRCPLYIVVRNNPKCYYRLFKRMYKHRGIRMLVVYTGFVLVLLTTVTLKLFL